MNPEDQRRLNILTALRRELREARELLAEAREWLCEHPGAPAVLQSRWWCTECQAYLRAVNDLSLARRIDEVLK